MKKNQNISSMDVNVNAKLPDATKRTLYDIIHQEFNNRASLAMETQNASEKAILEKYELMYGIKDMIKKREEIKKEIVKYTDERNKEMNKIEETMIKVGWNQYGYKGNDKIGQEIKAVRKMSNEVHTLKNKIIARLSLATTMGEATVIMREILGNNIIPTVNTNAITFQGESNG